MSCPRTLLTGARIRVPVPRRLSRDELREHFRDVSDGPEPTPWQAMVEAAALAGAL